MDSSQSHRPSVTAQQLALPGFDSANAPTAPAPGSGEVVPEELRLAPKGELHVHLNGLVSAETIKAIIADENTELPLGFDLDLDLVHRSACSSLANYLAPWQVLRRFPRRLGNLQRLVDSAFEGLLKNNVRFVELRSSVLYLSSLQECALPDALHRLIVATQIAADHCSIRRGLILTVTRGDYSAVHLDALLSAYRSLGCPPDVVGIDLAGDEEMSYPRELPGMFRAAKDRFGLGVTIHAGETGRPENVRDAIEAFGADRIGHGTAAGGNDWLMEMLVEHDVCVEVCPISNRLTGAVPASAAHPLREFQDFGVPFIICSDNPAIHERGLCEDYAAAMTEGVSLEALRRQHELAKSYSFIKDLR